MFHVYGLIVGIAIVVGWGVAERVEPKVNRVLPWVLLSGIVGARLYHVIDLWTYYSEHLGEVVAIWNGGLGIFGGIIGGIIILRVRVKSISEFWKVLGAIVVGLPLSQAIGRWGNLANNELWGKGHAPLFLYESALDLILFSVLWRFRGSAPKLRVGMYLVGYGLIRLLLEPMKIDPWWVGSLLSALFVFGGTILTWQNAHDSHVF